MLLKKWPITVIKARRLRAQKVRARLERRRVFLAAAGAAATGAITMHFFDRDRGRSRRTQIQDQVAGKVRRVGRRADRLTRHASSEAKGIRQRIAHREPIERMYDDPTLAQKVRSEVLGRDPFSQYAINVMAENGTVILNGEVRTPEDINEIEAQVQALPGVWEVRNHLHLPRTESPNKSAVTKTNNR